MKGKERFPGQNCQLEDRVILGLGWWKNGRDSVVGRR
jgi:hypothetical protein